jgi:predicted transcriptional regulator
MMRIKEKNSLSRERQDDMSVNGRDQLSTAVEELFTGAITKVKAEAEEAVAKQKAKSEAEAAEAIAKVRAEAEEKARAYTDTISRIKAEATEAIARVKAQAEEKARTYTDTIARIKAVAEEKARAYTGTAGKGKHSATVDALFSEAVAKQKAKSEAEAAKTIARVKAEAEEKAKAYTDTIARVKAEAEEEARKYVDMIARIKAEAEEKARAYANTAGEGKPSVVVDALFSEAVARQKAKSEAQAEEAIAEPKANSGDEAEKTMAEQKVKSGAEVEEKARTYTDTVGKVKAEAQEAISKVKAQVGAIARVKAEAVEAIAKVMAEAKEVITEVKAEIEEKARVYADTIAEVDAEEEAAMINESQEQPIFETFQRTAQSPAVLPGEHYRETPELCTKNIMQRKLVWGSPDDSVQQTFAKMQQHDAGYVMVGQNGVLEGIVSRSDLTGAISPYLQPVFAKWRRPLDDATLKIRIKWIMSRPVHIISPQMPLGAIMRNMCRFRVRALPVADRQGKVLGLVTEANIFKAILESGSDPNIPASNGQHQVQSGSPEAPERARTLPTETNQPSLVPA